MTVNIEHAESFMFLKIDKQTTDCVTFAPPFKLEKLSN